MVDFDVRMRELTYVWNDKESKFEDKCPNFHDYKRDRKVSFILLLE